MRTTVTLVTSSTPSRKNQLVSTPVSLTPSTSPAGVSAWTSGCPANIHETLHLQGSFRLKRYSQQPGLQTRLQSATAVPTSAFGCPARSSGRVRGGRTHASPVARSSGYPQVDAVRPAAGTPCASPPVWWAGYRRLCRRPPSYCQIPYSIWGISPRPIPEQHCLRSFKRLHGIGKCQRHTMTPPVRWPWSPARSRSPAPTPELPPPPRRSSLRC